MLAPGWPPCSSSLTTDAVVDAADARRRPARGHPDRRSTGSTPTAACPPTTRCCCSPRGASRDHPGAGRAGRGGHRGVRRPGPPADRRRRGRDARTSGSTWSTRPPRTTRSTAARAVVAQQPAQVRDPRRGPQLGPDPVGGRHHRRGVRARRASTSRSTGCSVCRDGAAFGDRAERRHVRPRGHDHRSTCAPGDAAATIWTNDLTAEYVHENSAYST